MRELAHFPNATVPVASAEVHSFAMAAPSDVSGLRDALDGGVVDAAEIACVLVKTEGNGLANDFTRELAESSLLGLLSASLQVSPEDVADRACIVCSGGTEGLITPHMTVMTVAQREHAPVAGPRLALGRAAVTRIAARDCATKVQVDAVEQAVRAAMEQAGIGAAADVHFVLVKAALPAGLDGAAQQQAKPALRAASALGVALALDEIPTDAVQDSMIGRNPGIWSRCACVTAAAGQTCSEVLVLGNSAQWAGRLICGSTVLGDMMDSPAVALLLRDMGFNPSPQLSRKQSSAIRAVFLKGEPPRLELRGERHAMWSDSDVHALRQYRAAMGGLLAATLGITRFYLSAGAEHQGPPGGACLSLITECTP